MRKTVVVTIEQLADKVVVSNNQGKKWEIPVEEPVNDDTSVNGVIAYIASAMLTGTIASQFRHTNARILKYSLTIDAI